MNPFKQSKPTGRITLLIGLLLTGTTAMSIEQPDYTVIESDGDIEYRQYDAYLVAETIIDADAGYRDAGNEGFRRLFRYISGNNTGQAKISMTAPVEQSLSDQTRGSEKIAMTVPVQQGASAEGWRVAFTLPKQYTLETAPEPRDPQVRVREVPARLVAAIRFSGRWTHTGFDRQYMKLAEAIDAASVTPIGAFQSAMYNAPFSLPFMRRNEVMVAVDRLPVTGAQTPAGAYAAN